jgi:hypothetical protein
MGPAMAASVMPITSHPNAICALDARFVAKGMVKKPRFMPLSAATVVQVHAP